MAPQGGPKKTLSVDLPLELHGAWAADAKKAGMTLSDFVRLAVEELRRLPPTALKIKGAESRRPARAQVAATVDPAKCTNRLRAGAWCKRCGSIHTKGI